MNIGILGTGAFGIALAITAFKNKNQITMWTKFEDEYDMLIEYRKNIKVLPDVTIPTEIDITLNIEKCVKDKDLIIIVVPSNTYNDVCNELTKYINQNQIICIASKGIYEGKFLSEIAKKYLKNNIAVISGPSFAIDLISNKPIGLSIASENDNTNKKIIKAFENNNLNLIETNDVIGVQICGTIKNAFAIGSGILNGLNCLESTKASYLTKCLSDTRKFLKDMGYNENTVLEYAGIGDLILTCNSLKSRNFNYGNLIGSKANSTEIEIFKTNNLIEGIYALKEIYNISKQKGAGIHTIDLIYNIVFNNEEPETLLGFINEKSKF